MADQVRELFGEEPSTLEDFALGVPDQPGGGEEVLHRDVPSGQVAPHRHHLVEPDRLLAEFSDAIVDYYLSRKLAFWFIQRSQVPVLLMVGEPEDWRCRLVIGNDTLKNAEGDYRVTEPGPTGRCWRAATRRPPMPTSRSARSR